MKENRIYIFYGVLAIGFLFLVARLFELQIIFGAKNRAIAEGNRIRKETQPAPRGIIYDRKGRELVRNVPIYRKCRAAGKASGDARQSLNFKCQIVSREEALKMEAQGNSDDLRMDIGREYPYGQTLAHVLGYLGETNEGEVRSGRWEMGDLIGRSGIEEQYDTVLRGKNGGELVEVDAQGQKIRTIGTIEPISGRNLNLSLDAELSKTAYKALSGLIGAVVVTEAKTGRVLVLVSSPSFDPAWPEKSLNDSRKPFFNRAIGGVYPPGSTFKIVTATAGLEEGKINKNTLYEDTGQIKVGDYIYKNWYFSQYGKTEGKIGLVQATKRSTDTFFYKVGEWLGARKLTQWAKAFGLNRKTGIDIQSEATGFVPDISQNWFLGNTYHLAIGQGDLLTTPLQVNMMTSVIANDGKLCKPLLVQNESQCQDLKLKPETLRLVKEGMKEACSSGGTAYPFFDFQPKIACKTGTAEFGDPKGRTHAWFTAFTPEIVVTVLVEAGGEGSSVAAPIAKKVMEEYFEK